MSQYDVPVWVCNVCGKTRLKRHTARWMKPTIGDNPYMLDVSTPPKGWKEVGNNLHTCSKKCAVVYYTEQEKKFKTLAKAQK